MQAFGHQPVLTAEVVAGLNAAPGKHFIDATLGDGGHTQALLSATAPDGRVLAIDWDAEAISRCQRRLAGVLGLAARVTYVHGNFKNLMAIARDHGFTASGGCLFDLGLASPQLDDPAAGFSFTGGPLDMRFDRQTPGKTAADVISLGTVRELAEIFARYGEEPLALPIARAVAAARGKLDLARADALAGLVAGVYRRRFPGRSRRHPATRVFQALRIVVNDELNNLAQALRGAVAAMPVGARLAVISYHSLEDRLVKNFFRTESRGCLCPPEAPRCGCDHQPTLAVLTRHPIRPTAEEIIANPRGRSAKLRLAARLMGIPPHVS